VRWDRTATVRRREGTARWWRRLGAHDGGGGIPVAIEEEEAVSASGNAAGPEGILGTRWLRDNEERYRASFDQAAVGILHHFAAGGNPEVQRELRRIVGYSPEELVGSNFQEITPPEDRDGGKAAAMHLLSGEVSNVSFEKRYFAKTGRSRGSR